MKIKRLIESADEKQLRKALELFIDGYASNRALRGLRMSFTDAKIPDLPPLRQKKETTPMIDIPYAGEVLSVDRVKSLLENPSVLNAAYNIIEVVNRSSIKLNMDQIISGLEPRHHAELLNGEGVIANKHIKTTVGTVLTLAGYYQKTGKAYLQSKTSRIWVPFAQTASWSSEERIEHYQSVLDMIPSHIAAATIETKQPEQTYSFI